MSAPVIVTAESRPRLARQAKMRHDAARGHWVILGPERILVPDATAVEILQICDGQRSVADVVAVLAEKYDADPAIITTDVLAMLQGLADQRFVTVDAPGTVAPGNP